MFTSCLDLLADALKELLPSFSFLQVDGDTVGEERNMLLTKFRKDPNISGLLLSYKVGSEGLNLIEANHCICIEPWWNGCTIRQGEARCYRNGQTRTVMTYKIYSENTIENKIIEICKSKDEMAECFLEGTQKQMTRVGIDKYTLGVILGRRY
jgi:SNF2 family DNA or RNA helicase